MTALSLDEIRFILPRRSNTSHKYGNGFVFSYAGSNRYPGSAALAAQGSMRVGAGGVYAHSEDKALSIILQHLPEGIPIPSDATPHEVAELLKTSRSILVGPGLHSHNFSFEKLAHLLSLSKLPTVMDAQAIHAIATAGVERFIDEIPPAIRTRALLTPHLGEAKRLLGATVTNDNLLKFVQETGVTLYVKGFPGRLVTLDKGVLEIDGGSTAATTAGCGDVLAGMFAGYLAQGLSVSDAAKAGVFVSNLASTLYTEYYGAHTMLASDVLGMIPRVLKEIYGSES